MPPKKDDGVRIPGKYATIIVSTLLSGAIAFNAWAVTAVYARPTEDRVTEMIKDKSPYTEDRKMILDVLQRIRDDISEIKQLIRSQ